jgi:hypothetical protein
MALFLLDWLCFHLNLRDEMVNFNRFLSIDLLLLLMRLGRWLIFMLLMYDKKLNLYIATFFLLNLFNFSLLFFPSSIS